METNCGSELDYTSYDSTSEMIFNIGSSYYWTSGEHSFNIVDLDSSFYACEIQYFDLYSYTWDSPSYKFTLNEAEKSLSLEILYHTSPGGTEMYTSKTYSILKLTADTLQLSGEGLFLSTYSSEIGIYTFTR